MSDVSAQGQACVETSTKDLAENAVTNTYVGENCLIKLKKYAMSSDAFYGQISKIRQ